MDINCNGSCAYQPVDPDDRAKALYKLMSSTTGGAIGVHTSFEEAAKVLNIPVEKVKQLYARGKELSQ